MRQGNQTHYDNAGEYTGDSTDLIYLRARFYLPQMGRFITKDTWRANATIPLSFNQWNYGYSNPIKYTDPSGNFATACDPASLSGLCLEWEEIEIFPGGPTILWPKLVPCKTKNPLQIPVNATPTTTPAPTATPGPKYEKVTAYRGMNKTSPSAIKPRIDPPEKELEALGAIGSFSVFENLPPGVYTYGLPFEITYQAPKQLGRIGTVVGLVAGEQVFSSGVAVYTPPEGHWSITIIGLSAEEIRDKVADFGVKYFGK